MASFSWVKLPHQGATPVLDLSSLGLPHDKDLQRKARKALEHPTDFSTEIRHLLTQKGVIFSSRKLHDKKLGRFGVNYEMVEKLRQ